MRNHKKNKIYNFKIKEMKSLIFAITIIAAGFSSESFAQDDPKSVQGAWNFIDKGRAMQFLGNIDALDTLGEDARTIYVDCAISLMEQSYENFDTFIVDGEEKEFLLDQCYMALLPADVINAMYGANTWSESDIEAYWNYAEMVREEMDDDSPALDLVFQCHLQKLQETYDGFDSAIDNETHFIELIETCAIAILGDE